jgi:hypothetical protein
MADQTDEELGAEVASILRRPADDPERLYLESWIEECEAMALYAKHLPEDGARHSALPGEAATPSTQLFDKRQEAG